MVKRRKSPKSRAAELLKAIHESCRPLVNDATAGDEVAIETLVNFTSEMASLCSNLAGLHRGSADTIARRRTSWPINFDPHPEMIERRLKWLSTLPIGAQSGWRRVGKKPYRLKNIANRTVALEIQLITTERALGLFKKTLPPIDGSQLARKTWFGEIWKRVKERHRGKPEQNAALRAIGKFKAEAKKDAYPYGQLTYEGNVREGIRQRLQDAMKAITTPNTERQ